MIAINNSNKYGALEYFTINCVDECLEMLQDDLMDRVVVNILPVKQSKSLESGGGAVHNINIFDKNFDGTRPPRLDEIISEITICNDIEKLIGKTTYINNFDKRFFDFINSVDVEVNKYSVFTMSLLHEIGHSHLVNLFLNVGMEKEYDNLYHMSRSTVMVTGSFKKEKLWEKTYKISLSQTTDVQENFADLYAVKNFLKVWNRVKHFIRPELQNNNEIIITRFNKKFNPEHRKYVTKVGLREIQFDKILEGLFR